MNKTYTLFSLSVVALMVSSASYAQCNTCQTTPINLENQPLKSVVAQHSNTSSPTLTTVTLIHNVSVPGDSSEIEISRDSNHYCKLVMVQSTTSIRDLSCTDPTGGKNPRKVSSNSIKVTSLEDGFTTVTFDLITDPSMKKIECYFIKEPTAKDYRDAISPMFDIDYPSIEKATLEQPRLGSSDKDDQSV